MSSCIAASSLVWLAGHTSAANPARSVPSRDKNDITNRNATIDATTRFLLMSISIGAFRRRFPTLWQLCGCCP